MRVVLSELLVLAIMVIAVTAWITGPKRAAARKQKPAKPPWHMGPIEAWYAEHILLPWKRLRWRLFGPAVALLLIASPAAAQDVVRYGVLAGQARRAADSLYRVSDSLKIEGAMCVARFFKSPMKDLRDTAYVVDSLGPARVYDATRYGIGVECPLGQPVLHTHPGSDALTDCNPGRRDYTAFTGTAAAPFEILLCSPGGAGHFYWDAHRPRPPGARRLTGSLSLAIAPLPTLAAPGSPSAPAASGRWRLSNDQFLAPLALGVAANAFYPLDRDAGGYRDRWTTPDKATHALAGYAIASLGTAAGVDRDIAFLGTCATAAAFEFTQGVPSRKDIVAGCAGAAVAVLWSRLFR